MQIIVRDNSRLKANDIKMRSIGQQLPAVGVLTLPDFGEQTLRVKDGGVPGALEGKRVGEGRGQAGDQPVGLPWETQQAPIQSLGALE